jgi:hypothetical protein
MSVYYYFVIGYGYLCLEVIMNVAKFCIEIWKNPQSKWLQPVMVIEECSELSKEMTKFLRGYDNIEHIKEEIADVEIVIESIKFGLGIFSDEIEQIKQEKINRYFEKHPIL